ncbi:hypothetical protein F442_19972 [Phytophthora nicotianae P10297]|uniref:BED-type domain-containing protein n=1 Tax=Phytophthora nicotianae P10297 TaxID=1317064 RepID=W2Y917_PHYNI|nr:hypothetical protein F442_19972 [Phytophthora nicotianae P10297]
MTGRAGAHGNAHFAQLKHLEKAPGNYWYCECRYCQAAFFNCETASRPVRIIGRPRNFKTHLEKYKHYKASLLQPTSPLSTVSTPPPFTTATAMEPHAISSGTRSQGAIREAGGRNSEVSLHP